jgi:tetratricopeptide (TPR) repeat protein
MTRDEALALYEEGLAAFRAGDQETSKAKNEAALEAARAAGDAEAESLALVGLSRVALRNGDYRAVCTLAAEARERVRGLGPAADARPLHLLAAGTRLAGDYDEARRLYTESLDLSRKLENEHGIWMELHNLGFVELHRENVQAAQALFAEAADLCGDDAYALAMTDLETAALETVHGQLEAAVEHLRAAQDKLRQAGIVLDPDDAFELDWLRRTVRQAP